MEWWGWSIVVILALLLVLFYRLYLRALTESRQLVNLLVMVLLKDDVREKQRANLISFIANSDARNASDIGLAVSLAVADLAVRLSGNTLAVAGMLWQVKREQPASK